MTPPQRPPASPTLAEAVRCPLLEGDLDGWVRCCTSRFLRVARSVAGDDDVAYEALQQSWVIVLEKLHQYRGESPACGWVEAIVRHEALHGAISRSRSRSRTVSLDAAGGADGLTVRQAHPAGAVGDSPEAAAYDREMMRLLLEVIDELPPTYRDVARLRDVEERPTDEVARRLRISSRNVRVRLHRAHKMLRPRLLRRLSGAAAAIPAVLAGSESPEQARRQSTRIDSRYSPAGRVRPAVPTQVRDACRAHQDRAARLRHTPAPLQTPRETGSVMRPAATDVNSPVRGPSGPCRPARADPR